MKFSPKSILSIGLVIAVGATAGTSYYSHIVFNEKWKNESIKVSQSINSFVSSYNDLLNTLYVEIKSQPVTKEKIDRIYDDWWALQNFDLNLRNVNFYGWRAYDVNDNEGFITVIDDRIGVSFSNNPYSVDEARKHNVFQNDNLAPYLNLKHYELDKSFIISKYIYDEVSGEPKSVFFVSYNKITFEQHFKEIVASSNNKVSMVVVWEGLHNFPFQREVYRQSYSIGGEPFYISYEPGVQWKFIGRDNIPGMSVGLLGIVLNILLFGYISTIVRRFELSENAKKNAEKSLSDQARFFEDFLNNLPGILFVKDARKDFQYYMFNREAEEFFGHSREDMIGKSDIDFFNESESAFFRSMDESAMRGRKVIDIPCETITIRDKEYFLHTRKVPIYDSKGNPLFLIGLSQDITKRKKNEMELAEYRENLEKIVAERTQKLKLATSKAEEASRLKSEFLATMSHEIRSPMSGVLGMAELLLDTPLTLEQKGLTRTILNSGEVLMNIIEDILDFSKIEANKLELDPIAVNMLELVDDVCLLYSPRAREKALELVVRYVPGCEQFVYADPLRLRQILGNILNNAIKFTTKGYITITVEEEVNADLPDDKVNLAFTVEDTGIGIKADDIDKIFEKFSQANSSTTRDYGGTGLGLSICRKLLDMMGGTISVNSTPGKGSAFHFNIPVTRNREETFTYPQPPALKDRKILIVDDLPVIRTLLSEQLTLAGMKCDAVSSGHEALSKLVDARDKGELYDMMVIDYLMPGMNGEMLARAIADEPDFRKICLIMLTAAGNPIVGDDFAEKGFSAYISKPVRATTLIDTLSIIWSKYQDGYTDTLIRVDTSTLNAARLEDDNHIRLEGSKVLLVEDSRLNQAFVEEVLSQLACDITTVSNGQEALDCIFEKSFDLILMDCQMPVMDGFEATRRICALKKEGKIPADLPILALTANAMKGDRQRCIDAGMDDYITKPVRKKELKEKIYFWIRREKIAFHEEHSDYADDDHYPESSDLVDIDLLNEAKSLLKDKFDFLLGCYIEDVETYIREMQDAVANRNIEGVVRPAHTIKSTSKRMGALRLSNIARDIEFAARETANSNGTRVDTVHMMEDIRHITSVFEETRKSLMGKA